MTDKKGNVLVCVAVVENVAAQYGDVVLNTEKGYLVWDLLKVTRDDVERQIREGDDIILVANIGDIKICSRKQLRVKPGVTVVDPTLLNWVLFAASEVVQECPITPGQFNVIRSRLRGNTTISTYGIKTKEITDGTCA